METRQQGSTLFSAVLVLIALLVVIQLWLVAAALDALVARQFAVLVPTEVTRVNVAVIPLSSLRRSQPPADPYDVAALLEAH